MATVWVVEEGQYSDYKVVGVFSSEANARLVLEMVQKNPYADRPSITEWPLDPIVDELRQGLRTWTLHMCRDGTVDRWIDTGAMDAYDMKAESRVWRRQHLENFRGKPDVLIATVWATDQEHAIKVANERRAELIATGQWDDAT